VPFISIPSPTFYSKTLMKLSIVTTAFALICLPALAQTTVEQMKALNWDKTHRGTPLDMSKYEQTFIDNFDKMSVTVDGGAGPWFAPVHSTFGAGKFVPPGPDGPYTIADGKLTLSSDKTIDSKGKGRWTSCNMQTVDGKGQGFAQQYGYFEISYKAPPGPGTWLGFWLLSQNGYTDTTKTRTEIDVVEWYGGDARGVHTTVHLWPAAKAAPGGTVEKHVGRANYFNLAPILTEGKLQGFHTYGVEVTPDLVIGYFDRKETGRFPTLPEFKTPLYMLITNAVFPKQADLGQSPMKMVVDYVAAYKPKDGTK